MHQEQFLIMELVACVLALLNTLRRLQWLSLHFALWLFLLLLVAGDEEQPCPAAGGGASCMERGDHELLLQQA